MLTATFFGTNLPKYDGHEQLDTFLQRFEEILMGEGVPTEQWVQLLTRAQRANLPRSDLYHYLWFIE